MRSDMVPGAIFPDYELSDHTAKHRKLSELQGDHPMVLVLSRGSFCPKDRRQAEGLLQLHREMEVGYCRLVTISTDNITQTNENRSGIGAHWPFLSDPRRIVQKDLDSRIHRSRQQSHDSARDCAGARLCHSQDLQWLLVLRTTHDGRAAPRPACCQQEMPAGLGHHNART
jgi:peroxiredoxin